MRALSYATAQLLRVLPRTRVSRAAGRLADHKWPARVGSAVVSVYSRLYDVTFDECKESSGWASFDAFFTRGLKDGARPVDATPRVLVSPADGRLDTRARVEADGRFVVKGRPYSAEELLGSADEAKRYAGGAACVVYLSPRDYHRVHSPCAGTIAFVRSMPGDYFPVNAIGLEHVPKPFVRNRRVAIAIDTPDLGRVTVVMVAAIIVGRITVRGIDSADVPFGVHRPTGEGARVERGEEVGMFHLGSTAVCFFERSAAGEWVAPAGPIRYGAAMLRAIGSGAGERGGAGGDSP